MIQGLIGKKIGMTHMFAPDSRVVPVTALEVGPCVVTQVRTLDRDGYEAVQLGFGQAKLLNKPARGHLKAAGAESRVLREFSADNPTEHNVGDELPVTVFQPGDIVDITSRTKGRGFQGAVKRYGFGGGRKTHGQGDRYRAVGSIGAGTYPGRVYKGKKMPGHMGNRRVTARKLMVERVDPERNILFVRGAVPGARNSVLTVKYAVGTIMAERLSAEEWAALLGSSAQEAESSGEAVNEALDAAVEEASEEGSDAAVEETPEEESDAAVEEASEEESDAAVEEAPEEAGTDGEADEQKAR